MRMPIPHHVMELETSERQGTFKVTFKGCTLNVRNNSSVGHSQAFVFADRVRTTRAQATVLLTTYHSRDSVRTEYGRPRRRTLGSGLSLVAILSFVFRPQDLFLEDLVVRCT